jgi:predicted ATPase
MALSGPLRESTRQPASAAISMLWTIFDLHDGRWMGNPLREDTWSKPGPFLGAAYALGEGFSRLDSEAAFLRPSGGPVFDNLGLYQLVKRRCRLIIACDASTDPTYTFTDLSVAIRRCRTELGVDIEMDLGPLVRRGTVTGTHGQIAVIHYPDGEPGWMLYLKPSFTGDEPADLVQYAAAHPDFPATDAAPGSFDEADFELYRRLGRHIVESLLAQVESPAELPVEQIFRAIRRRLQPDFKESETLSDPSTAQPPEAPPQELIDIIASRECLLWSGPGLAAQAKSPTWPSFLEGLLHVAREAGALDPVAASGLAATLAAGELEAAADELTHQVPREMLLEYVGAATSVSDPSPAHQLLAKMPFLGVLNTSFDELLASAFGSPTLVPAQTEKLIRALRTKSFFVTNVLGSASQPSSLLFTLKELRMLLAANLHFKQFLSTFFLRYNVLFVGSSIDGLRAYLEVLELPQTPERRHYALVASAGPLDPVKLRFLERSYNLHILEYPPGFNFAGLPAFLKRLQSSVSEKVPPARPEGARVLKSVTLENIGPFDSLRLELTPTWNLLLGDNGVGKTVVLRAIAAALCGDEADSEAVARLLRSGTDSGSILLAVEGREYKVELKRDPDGKVRIVAASLSPINYDRWLVLGFPALRSIPWDRPKGPSAPGPEAPSADDLLPILRSVPDERIADIKQWLINLDYAAGSEPEPSRSKALLDGFFEILQKLTPDLRIKLHSIDKKTMEITLETDSGLVPLEAISQGTGSVLCWIGTLLERLSEAGSEGAALVLIDEIDAHMHPKWQQLFVGAFRDQFKEVQVIATTHSPLLVGSLKPEEIWLVHRAPLRSEIYGVVHLETTDEGAGQEIVILGPEDDPDEGQPPAPREERRYRLPVGAELLVKEGEVVEDREPLTTKRVVVAERMPFGPEGFRVDQILTSPLFNLETTRDPDTSALMNEYSRLVAFENPTEDDRRALARVAGQLQIRVATPQEQETARLAFGLIQDFANERLRSLPPEERQKVLAEVKVQMTESITGSWRPE